VDGRVKPDHDRATITPGVIVFSCVAGALTASAVSGG